MTEAKVRALFELANIPVERLKRLPNGYMGELTPLTDEQIEKDTPGHRGVVGVFPTHSDGVVRAWMADYRWRCERAWWFVKTPFGWIEIGWRKRVIQIDWSETPIRQEVTTDDVTKHLSLVHAWSESKAIEYLVGLNGASQRITSSVAEANAERV